MCPCKWRLSLVFLLNALFVYGNENPSAVSDGKSLKTDYSPGGIGTYSRGGLYSQSVVSSHHNHDSGTEGCNMDEFSCLSMVSQDRLGLDAIRSLHRQLDDDADGNVDFSESDEFLREDLKYEDGYQRRQQAFHRNDDKHISVRELWEAWIRSEVHNWTVDQTTEWLASNVELPQYIPTFREHLVTGATLPRLAVSNSQYMSVVLGIKDPIHKQKISLKAMDVVLFGPPKDYHHHTKDAILVTLILVVLCGFYFVYRQQKSSSREVRRMMKDLESLHRAEQALEDLQRELELAKKEQESVATEKLNLERRLLEQSGSDEGMKISYSDLEVTQLKAQVESLKTELLRAEGELQDRCWSPPVGLQQWLQLTYEIENKAYLRKKMVADKKYEMASEACEKLKKKRTSPLGAFMSTHGKTIDDVDRCIIEARTSLNELTAEFHERLYRWRQIEQLCHFNVINNSGLQHLESVLYRGQPNGRVLRGRMSASQDNLEDDSISVHNPSAGILDLREGSESGSEPGKSEYEDEFCVASAPVPGNVHFQIGGDWADDIPPIPIVPKRTHKSSMVRSYSQDTNVNAIVPEREREIPAVLNKLSQSETNLEAPVIPVDVRSKVRSFARDPETEEPRTVPNWSHRLRNTRESEDFNIRSRTDAFRRNFRDDEELRKTRDSSMEDQSRRQVRLNREASEDNGKLLSKFSSAAVVAEDREDTYSTDSNSAATEVPELDTKRKRSRKIFAPFRKDRAKNS